jgi:general secretion pathway protein D
MRAWVFAVIGWAILLVASPAHAQKLPTPIRSNVPKAVQGRDLRAQDARRLKSPRPDAASLKESRRERRARGRDKASAATPGNGQPATLPTMPTKPAADKKIRFDAKEIEKEIEQAEVEDAIKNKTVEDVITFKTNFEKEAKCQKLPLDLKINLDMQDAALEDLLKFFSCIMEKNFLLTDGIPKGKSLTILATRPVTVYEAWKAFLSTLEANNMTLVRSGAFLQITEIGKSKSKNIPFLKSASDVPDDDSVMTVLVPLEHLDAQEVEPILSKFKSPYGDLTIYAPTNTIFLTDNGTTIRKLMKLLKELDVPGGKERIWIRQIEYAEAGEIASKIQEVFESGKSSGGRPTKATKRARQVKGRKGKSPAGQTTVAGDAQAGQVTVSKVIADERTNQLIILANRSSYMRVDKLIRKLDVPIEGEGAIHIYYLENADAEEVSSTLSNLISGSGSSSKSKKSKKKKSKKSKGGVASLLEGEVKVTADKGTNALVLQASLKDFLSLKKVIQKLDIRRKQVYVEAVIMEITTSKSRKLGISGSGGKIFDYDGTNVPLLLGLGGLGMSGLDPSQLTKGGLAVGLQGPLTDVSTGSTGDASAISGSLSVPTFGFLLQAIQSNSDVNILSTPHILTLDNEEAEIQVGKQIPYRSSSMGGMGGLSSMMSLAGGMGMGGASRYGGGGMSSMMNPYSMMGGMGGMGMVQRIDVDLSLKITPQVNESDFVKLKIDQSIEDVESLDVELGPTTSKRKVTNTVVVRDQQPVVIGGLIRDTESKAIDKIPILGDIPLIGLLFRKTTTRTEKKNLLMVITPYIIDDPSDLKRIQEEKADEIERYSSMMAAKAALPEFRTDYRKKHGTLEEINKVVNEARREREQRERMLFEETQTETVGPPDTHDIDYDPFAKDKKPLAGDDAPVRILYQGGEASNTAAPAAVEALTAPAPAPEAPASDDGDDASAGGQE